MVPKKSETTYHQETVLPLTVVTISQYSDSLPQIQSYYSWIRILRVTAWIRRFINNARTRRRSPNIKIEPLEVAICLDGKHD